jgi:hypothetical protein
MKIRLPIALAIASLFFVSGYAQTQDQDKIKELYNKIEIEKLLPSVGGLEKLTAEEKEKLKVAILDLYRASYATGYKAGGEYVFKSFESQIKDFVAKMDADELIRPEPNDGPYTQAVKESKLKKGLRIFLVGLVAFGQGYAQAQQNDPYPSYTPLTQPTVNSAKKYVKKIIDRGQYVLLDDNSLWEINSLDRLTSSLWMSIDEIIIVGSGFETKLLNTRDNKSVTAKRVK